MSSILKKNGKLEMEGTWGAQMLKACDLVIQLIQFCVLQIMNNWSKLGLKYGLFAG